MYISCFIYFINISMKIRNTFYKNVAFGFTICFIFQTFLNIGGVTKFIPSTGVTLPLVSYGVSSVVSTLFLFGIIQGICVLENNGVGGNEEQTIYKQSNHEEVFSGVEKKSKKRKMIKERSCTYSDIFCCLYLYWNDGASDQICNRGFRF